jgi:hypothetical protein
MRNGRFPPRIVQETKRSLLTLRCELHPENFGEWHSEAEMDQDKRDLARRIGLIWNNILKRITRSNIIEKNGQTEALRKANCESAYPRTS